jgi:hypothetical protein
VQSWCSTGSIHEFVRMKKVSSAITRASRSRGIEQTTGDSVQTGPWPMALAGMTTLPAS